MQLKSQLDKYNTYSEWFEVNNDENEDYFWFYTKEEKDFSETIYNVMRKKGKSYKLLLKTQFPFIPQFLKSKNNGMNDIVAYDAAVKWEWEGKKYVMHGKFNKTRCESLGAWEPIMSDGKSSCGH